jgi:cytochrome c553
VCSGNRHCSGSLPETPEIADNSAVRAPQRAMPTRRILEDDMKFLVLFAVALLLPVSALADAMRGAQLSASCAHCHGTDGNSSASAYPNLAGQTKEYVYRQIKAFKEGQRTDPQMSPMVGILSEQDMHDLAEFYNQQSPPRKRANTDQALSDKGKAVAEQLQCAVCHQPGFKGLNEFPRLSRQKQPYLIKQLKAYRDGTRTNDNGVMAPTAKNLTDEQIEALAHYLSGL